MLPLGTYRITKKASQFKAYGRNQYKRLCPAASCLLNCDLGISTMMEDTRIANKWNDPLFSIPFKFSNTGAKGIGCASTSWAAVGAGKLVDEVEACLDIIVLCYK